MTPNNPRNNIVGITFSTFDFFFIQDMSRCWKNIKTNPLQEKTTVSQTESNGFTTVATPTFAHQIFAKNSQKRTK